VSWRGRVSSRLAAIRVRVIRRCRLGDCDVRNHSRL
jgi:hypothetical protein